MEFDHSADSINPDDQVVITIGGTGGLVVPSGTTAQRPAIANGTLRYNTDTASLDVVVNNSFQLFKGISAFVTSGITAAGTTQGTATPISGSVSNVTSVAVGTGVVLPTPTSADRTTVVNKGANALLVYPASGGAIGTLGANIGFSLGVNRTLTVVAVTSTQWEVEGDSATIGAGGSGTVTSVALSAPSIFSVSGSPISSAGTLSLALASQTAGTIFAAPAASAGTPIFRTLAVSDVPVLNQNSTGSSATLTTTRTFATSGDAVSAAQNFNGSQNVVLALVLATVNVSPQTDTFRKITVTGKGLNFKNGPDWIVDPNFTDEAFAMQIGQQYWTFRGNMIETPTEEQYQAILKAENQSLQWTGIKNERDRRKYSGARMASNGKWFDSDDPSRIQQLGIVMMGANLPPNVMWKTMDGSFVTMTPALAAEVFQTIAARDMSIFKVAEQHRAQMMASATPHSYDMFNNSPAWPLCYGE